MRALRAAFVAMAMLTSLLAVAGPVTGQGCTINWTGSAEDGLLTTAGNWLTPANGSSEMRVPNATDIACIFSQGEEVSMNAGTFSVAGLESSSPIRIDGGTLSVSGDIHIDDVGLTNVAGTLSLGVDSFVDVTDFTQGSQGTTVIRIGPNQQPQTPDPGRHSRIDDFGDSSVAGRIFVQLVEGYLPDIGTEFVFLVSRGQPVVTFNDITLFTATAVDGTIGDGRAYVAEETVSDGIDAAQIRVVQEPPPPPPPITVTLSSDDAVRGPDGTADVPLTATLSRTTTTDVDVEVIITGGGTSFAQADPVGLIKIPPGETAASIAMQIDNDTPPPVTASVQSVTPSTVQVAGDGTTEVTLLDPPPGPAADVDDPALAPLGFEDTCLVDTEGLGIAKTEPLSTSQVALGSLGCAAPTAVDRIVIGRDDDFADSLSSGVLQADAPLLLVPGDGPVPAEVIAALAALDVGQIVIMGGTAAIGQAVENQLTDLGMAVDRREGPTRIETAIDVAATDAADATTAIIARAFAGDADPSQAFADAIAAGGMAADLRYPVLLTDTAQLSASTADYLAGSAITDLLIMGGTAAVSDAVQTQLQAIVPGEVTRVAGDSRFGTAVEVAKARGAESAADVAQVMLVEGQTEDAWAAGLSVAFQAARDDAPIVLLNGEDVPEETAAFLTGETEAGMASFAVDVGDDVVTCAGLAEGCVEARRLLGLDGRPVTFDPPSLSPAVLGGAIEVGFPEGVPGDADTIFAGSCLPATTRDLASVVIREDAALPCLVTVTITYTSGVVQQSTAAYVG